MYYFFFSFSIKYTNVVNIYELTIHFFLITPFSEKNDTNVFTSFSQEILVDNTYAIFCNDHKLENMVNINNICKHEKCSIKAKFNYESEKKGLYCSKHKLTNMIEIK